MSDKGKVVATANKETLVVGGPLVRAALARGIHGVTANKGPVVHAYRELTALGAAPEDALDRLLEETGLKLRRSTDSGASYRSTQTIVSGTFGISRISLAASGDVFKFVQEIEHVDFVTAVEQVVRIRTGETGADAL